MVYVFVSLNFQGETHTDPLMKANIFATIFHQCLQMRTLSMLRLHC